MRSKGPRIRAGPRGIPKIRRACTLPMCVALTVLAATPVATRAQQISGRLLDLQSNRPIPGGILRLLSVFSDTLQITVSDPEGHWRLDVPGAGSYRIAADGFGYRSDLSEVITVGTDDVLEAVFHLEPVAILLDPIEVEIRRTREYLELTGFFERQRSNFGHFITPEAIDRRQATRVTDLLVTVPGVRIGSMSSGSAGPPQVELRGSSLSRGGTCRPRVFVDGLMYNPGDSRPVFDHELTPTEERVEQMMREEQALSLDDIGHPSTIAGIEVYRSASQVPAQFGGTSVETLCGVIVVWTRTGRPTGRGG
jgi:hypothetical protein